MTYRYDPALHALRTKMRRNRKVAHVVGRTLPELRNLCAVYAAAGYRPVQGRLA